MSVRKRRETHISPDFLCVPKVRFAWGWDQGTPTRSRGHTTQNEVQRGLFPAFHTIAPRFPLILTRLWRRRKEQAPLPSFPGARVWKRRFVLHLPPERPIEMHLSGATKESSGALTYMEKQSEAMCTGGLLPFAGPHKSPGRSRQNKKSESIFTHETLWPPNRGPQGKALTSVLVCSSCIVRSVGKRRVPAPRRVRTWPGHVFITGLHPRAP